jgi:hypothetical protein
MMKHLSDLSTPALTVTCSSKHRLAHGRAVGSGDGQGTMGVTRAATLTAAPVTLWAAGVTEAQPQVKPAVSWKFDTSKGVPK